MFNDYSAFGFFALELGTMSGSAVRLYDEWGHTEISTLNHQVGQYIFSPETGVVGIDHPHTEVDVLLVMERNIRYLAGKGDLEALDDFSKAIHQGGTLEEAALFFVTVCDCADKIWHKALRRYSVYVGARSRYCYGYKEDYKIPDALGRAFAHLMNSEDARLRLRAAIELRTAVEENISFYQEEKLRHHRREKARLVKKRKVGNPPRPRIQVHDLEWDLDN